MCRNKIYLYCIYIFTLSHFVFIDGMASQGLRTGFANKKSQVPSEIWDETHIIIMKKTLEKKENRELLLEYLNTVRKVNNIAQRAQKESDIENIRGRDGQQNFQEMVKTLEIETKSPTFANHILKEEELRKLFSIKFNEVADKLANSERSLGQRFIRWLPDFISGGREKGIHESEMVKFVFHNVRNFRVPGRDMNSCLNSADSRSKCIFSYTFEDYYYALVTARREYGEGDTDLRLSHLQVRESTPALRESYAQAVPATATRPAPRGSQYLRPGESSSHGAIASQPPKRTPRRAPAPSPMAPPHPAYGAPTSLPTAHMYQGGGGAYPGGYAAHKALRGGTIHLPPRTSPPSISTHGATGAFDQPASVRPRPAPPVDVVAQPKTVPLPAHLPPPLDINQELQRKKKPEDQFNFILKTISETRNVDSMSETNKQAIMDYFINLLKQRDQRIDSEIKKNLKTIATVLGFIDPRIADMQQTLLTVGADEFQEEIDEQFMYFLRTEIAKVTTTETFVDGALKRRVVTEDRTSDGPLVQTAATKEHTVTDDYKDGTRLDTVRARRRPCVQGPFEGATRNLMNSAGRVTEALGRSEDIDSDEDV